MLGGRKKRSLSFVCTENNWFKYRLRSFEDCVGFTCFFLSDFLDFHQDHCFGSANDNGSLSLALVALQSEGDFLGGLGLLSEDRFGLSTISWLFAVVTSSALSSLALLTLLVLSNFVDCVTLALRAVGLPGFRNHHHFMTINIGLFN